MDMVAFCCDLEHVCHWFEPCWLPAPGVHRQRACSLALSEVLTILVAFHSFDYRTFQHFYWNEVCAHGRGEFSQLPSYTRWVECIPSTLIR